MEQIIQEMSIYSFFLPLQACQLLFVVLLQSGCDEGGELQTEHKR
jgi:hypothetical protein